MDARAIRRFFAATAKMQKDLYPAYDNTCAETGVYILPYGEELFLMATDASVLYWERLGSLDKDSPVAGSWTPVKVYYKDMKEAERLLTGHKDCFITGQEPDRIMLNIGTIPTHGADPEHVRILLDLYKHMVLHEDAPSQRLLRGFGTGQNPRKFAAALDWLGADKPQYVDISAYEDNWQSELWCLEFLTIRPADRERGVVIAGVLKK